MIEKPKRPKQPSIQERQPPRTLQELINRYDLDNTKIYDFLDELVSQINAERDSLSNEKVNKSGDSMTGSLNLQNNAVKFSTAGYIEWKEQGFGDKFRIIPDFVNTGANNKLIIQSTIGDAGTDPTNWKDLVYIRADTGDVELAGDLGTVREINYEAWHSVVLTRSDGDRIYIMLYGSNNLKKGNYNIRNDFKIYTFGTTTSELTIPRSAISGIYRKNWGFELFADRNRITGDTGNEYNGVAVVSYGNLILESLP